LSLSVFFLWQEKRGNDKEKQDQTRQHKTAQDNRRHKTTLALSLVFSLGCCLYSLRLSFVAREKGQRQDKTAQNNTQYQKATQEHPIQHRTRQRQEQSDYRFIF
jgi:hypothetical protein